MPFCASVLQYLICFGVEQAENQQEVRLFWCHLPHLLVDWTPLEEGTPRLRTQKMF